MKYDFSGYATRNDIKCSDGRVIMHNAFASQNGQRVPLVWAHRHDSVDNVLGFVDLENRPDGVYCRGAFNDTPKGAHAKASVKHGDMDSLSIFANRLQQEGPNVVHGMIREVSLVLAGANPGAHIDNVIAHGDDGYTYEQEDQADMAFGCKIELAHAEDDKTETDTITETTTEKKEDEKSEDDLTIKDVYDSLNEQQKLLLDYAVDMALSGELSDEEDNKEDNNDSDKEEGEEVMHKNVFETVGENGETSYLSHDELQAVFDDAKRIGSLEKSFLEHGVTNLDVLFPEAQLVTPTPEMITRKMDWVAKVWNATTKSPFARIKSTAADLTKDDARAKGYIKGKKKVEEQFELLKRVTTPQTVYKKQKLDRDDIIDIVDIDVVAWLKAEMRLMLDEELSRAILIGDGRSNSSEDKIKEDNVRPIFKDADTYTIHFPVTFPANADRTDKSNALVDAAIEAREDYQGSGLPTYYGPTHVVNTMLLARNSIGERMYKTKTELADALGVQEIIEVPVMKGATRTDSETNKTYESYGLIVNLADYVIGADRGGAVSLFDDFDIDYNQNKYLIETRCSGALKKPYSAISLEVEKTTGSTGSGEQVSG